MTTSGRSQTVVPSTDGGRARSLLRLEQEVGVLFRRVRRVVGDRARAVHPDLQPAAYLLLSHLHEHGPMRASGLSELFSVDKGAVSRQVQHLVDLGLVDRTPDPEDGRATLVSVSPSGAERLADVVAHRRRTLDERLAEWSQADLDHLADVLASYNTALSDR